VTRVDRMEPGQALAEGAVSRARPASTVIVVRGGAGALEVLLVQRTHAARFMAGAWVFPGGAVDPADGTGDAGHRAAAVRELREEAAIDGLGPGALVPFSRWTTPEGVRVRFDTWFFLARLPAGAVPAVDGAECIDLLWTTPAEALERRAAGTLSVMFPTAKHLERLSAWASADAVLAAAAADPVVPVQPRLVVRGDETHVLLPGEPGYDDAP
jgi:8-oxo-dGTP pyrophosphatase MutT (NUDIX family)